MSFKQSLVLDKSKATLINNKYVFELDNFLITKWRVKQCYFPQDSLQTQITSNDGEIDSFQTQITSNDSDITTLQTSTNTNTSSIGTNTTNITNITNTMSTDTERLAAITALTTAYTGADTSLNNTITTALTTKISSSEINTPYIIYVDSNNQNSYTADGSFIKPYTSLSAALTAKLADNSTQTYIFKLAPGDYVGTISIDKTQANQSFTIEGSGIDKTFIKGSVNWDGNTGNILYFRDFLDITLKNCTIKNGAYGFYPRACRRVEIDGVKFIHCGSEGTVNRHNLTSTKQNQIDYWASSSTNDGGATRLRSCNEVLIHDSQIEYTLRGFRIQDCGIAGKNSIVCNNKMYRVLEGSIYLASGNYTASLGSENFTITGNTVKECYNNSILVIGGKNNVINNNNVNDGANTGIMCWHSLDVKIHHNSVYNCNRLTYNGIGNDGDAYGAIVVDGNTNIGTGDHMAIIHSNSMLKCNQGRASSIIAVNIKSSSYPQASNKIVHADNITDATDKIINVNNIPVASVTTTVTDPQTATNTQSISTKQDSLSFGLVSETGKTVLSQNIKSYGDANWAGGGLTGDDTSTSSNAMTKLKIQNTATNGQVEILLADLDPSGDMDDHQYRFITQSDNLQLYAAFFQNNSVTKTETLAYSIGKNGNIVFHGAGANTSVNFNAANFMVRGTARFYNTVLFSSETTVGNNLVVGNANTTYTIKLNDKSIGGVASRFDTVVNDQSYNTQLTTEKDVTVTRDGGTTEGGAMSYTLPVTADIEDGHTIYFHSYAKPYTQDGVGYTIFLEMSPNQSINPRSADHDKIVIPQYNRVYFRFTDRMTFCGHFDKPNQKWHFRCVSDTRQQQLNTPFFKFFPNNETAHAVSGASTNAYILEPYHNYYRIVYGDGTAQVNLSGVRIRLPYRNLVDGTTVELFTNHNLNSTNASEILFITWNTIGNEPVGRRIVENDTFYTYTQGNNFSGEMRIEAFSNASGRGIIKYIYCASIDAWIYQRESY